MLLLSGLALGCLGPADGVLVLEGTVIANDGKPIDNCKLALCSPADGHTITWQRVKARFQADFVVSPRGREYLAELSCPGYPEVYRSRPFLSKGHLDGQPVQLGVIRLPVADLKK